MEESSFNTIKKAKKNIAFGFVNKAVLMLCPFIERTVINYALGSQYLGLNSLFSSILMVLSLSELGFSSAIVYNMYKPVAEGDTTTVNALLNFYKKAYRIIGFVILGLGLAVIPFLPKLINGTAPAGINIKVLYLIYLANSVISYFSFAYMSSIIVVHQRDDINSICNTAVKILLTVSQIAALMLTENYYLFAILMPIFTVVNNIWIALMVKRQFPQYKCEGNIPKESIGGIRKLVAGTFIQKACAVTRNSLDSICVSAFLGLTLTAIYNNYFYILNAITMMLGIISTSFLGGIGNHVATKTKEENFEELKKLDFAYLWLAGWCATCLLCLYQPFMELWMGKDMMLPFPAIILFCIYFYVLKLGDMRSMYTDANGLYWETRYRAISETVLNLSLNIILGKLWGIYGIISATIISLILCNYIWSTRITFKHYFGIERIKQFYKYQIKQTAVETVVCLITFCLCSTISLDGFEKLLTNAVICIILPNLLLWIIYRKSPYYGYLISKIHKGNAVK